MSVYFENYEPIDESGIVSWTPYIFVDQVQEAYLNGIFPWPESEDSVFWFSPHRRGILFFKDYSLNKSTKRAFRKTKFEFKVNHDFAHVIQKCAQVKKEIDSVTWITQELMQTYIELHKQGWAISFEAYLDEELVGAVYGVQCKKYLSAESMFYTVSNASKFAIHGMIEYLQKQGMSWIDTQMVTPFTKKIGARYISRKDFLSLHKQGII